MGLFGGEMVQDVNLVAKGMVIEMGSLIHTHFFHFHKMIGFHNYGSDEGIQFIFNTMLQVALNFVSTI